MLVETQPRTTINRMDVIEAALRCPDTNVVDPEREIDKLRSLWRSLVGKGDEHSEKMLGIANDVWIDARIARKRVTGVYDPVVMVRREKNRYGKEIDPITYASSYIDKLSQQLRVMSMNGTTNLAMVITNQMYERISEYEDKLKREEKIFF